MGLGARQCLFTPIAVAKKSEHFGVLSELSARVTS